MLLAPCVGELMRHLIAGFVAFPARPAWLPDETDGEASFSVHKTSNPAKLNQPFLLIVRTHHVVTTFRMVVWDTRVFQHMAECSVHHYWQTGQRSVTLGPSKLLLSLGRLGRAISARLCMSPCRSDYIILGSL